MPRVGRMPDEKLKQRAIERLTRKTIKIENCWVFNGSLDKNGYGLTKFKGKMIRVSRLSLHIYKNFRFDRMLTILA